MKKILLGTAAAFCLSSAAYAADLPVYEEPAAAPVVAPYDWTGFYLGLHAGYAWGDYKGFSPLGRGPNVDVDGFAGGAQAGYNWQFDSFVLGLEADISSGPEGDRPVGAAGPVHFCGTGRCNTDVEYFWTVRARLGYAMDNLLLYGTGGYAGGRVEGGIKNSNFQGSSTNHGWTAGAGLEYGFTQNITAKAEYLYVDLGDVEFGSFPYRGDGDFSVVRVGVNYKFNW